MPGRERLRRRAAHGSTLVLFLSTRLLKKVREELLESGLSPDTPCAVCYKVTWEDEKILRGTVKQLPELAEAAGVRKTALIVVGEVLGSDYELSRLYAADFSTEFRQAREGEDGNP